MTKKLKAELKTKLRKGDTVVVITGKYKGAKGKILEMVTKKKRCIVEGVALAKKHVRATKQDEKSQIIQKEASIHISNVMLYDEESKKGVKAGYKMDEKGNKTRYLKVKANG